jgi:hypothetical protein
VVIKRYQNMSQRVRPSLHQVTPLQDAVRANTTANIPQMAMGNVKSNLSQSTDRDQSVQDKPMVPVQRDKAWPTE